MKDDDFIPAIVGIERAIRHLNGSLIDIKRELLKRSAEASKPALKVIDWDGVADCVPVKAWDDRKDAFIFYPCHLIRQFDALDDWRHRSLVTGIPVAWSGGERPLPEGVMVEITRRDGRVLGDLPTGFNWRHDGGFMYKYDIIHFTVTSLADGYAWEASE